MSRATDLPTIVVVAALPPPVHGQALVNAAVVERLRSYNAVLTVINTSPQKRRKGPTYHLARIRQFIRAASSLLMHRCSHIKTLYMPLEAGYGMFYNMLLSFVARLAGFSVVLHHHSSAHSLSYSFRFAVLAALSGRNAVHVALSERMGADLRARYGQIENVIVSTNAVHVRGSRGPSRRRPPKSPLIIGHLANLSAAKGLSIVIDSTSRARAAGQSVKLVLAGPVAGQTASNEIARARESLQNAVDVTGPLYGEEKDWFYNSIDIFLFPTRYKYEAQPLVVYEAISYGVPVIATEAGYIAEMLTEIGTTLPDDDNLTYRLTDKICALTEQPELLRVSSMSARACFDNTLAKSQAQFTCLCNFIARQTSSPNMLELSDVTASPTMKSGRD